MSIAQICQRHIITIGALATLREAAALMREHHVGALVVTAEAGGQNQVVGVLTGLVTADDLLDALAGQLGGLAAALRSGIARETSARRSRRRGHARPSCRTARRACRIRRASGLERLRRAPFPVGRSAA